MAGIFYSVWNKQDKISGLKLEWNGEMTSGILTSYCTQKTVSLDWGNAILYKNKISKFAASEDTLTPWELLADWSKEWGVYQTKDTHNGCVIIEEGI